MPIERDARVFVAGHRGLVGGALLRKLQDEGFTNVLTASRHELDLRDQAEVGAAPNRPARADERVVCDREDRGHQAVPGVSPAVWA